LRINSGHQGDYRIILVKGLPERLARKTLAAFWSWVDVDEPEVAFAGAVFESSKKGTLRREQCREPKVFRSGADNDQIVFPSSSENSLPPFTRVR
jgi:hypothetical protein